MKLPRVIAFAALAITTFTFGASAIAQTSRFTTSAGGDSSGNFLSVESNAHEGTLHGDRRVERLDVHGGYTTGSLTEIVIAGSEPEAIRTLRVHLPYGIALDLARGDRVHVEVRAQRRGLGSAYEVLVTRGSDVVLLATSNDRAAGIAVARGAEATHDSSHRTFELSVTYAGHATSVGPRDLAYLSPVLLAGGVDSIYEGRRPPDAFDQRLLTVARVRPSAAH